MLADVNLDKDLELVGPSGRIAVSSVLFNIYVIFSVKQQWLLAEVAIVEFILFAATKYSRSFFRDI